MLFASEMFELIEAPAAIADAIRAWLD